MTTLTAHPRHTSQRPWVTIALMFALAVAVLGVSAVTLPWLLSSRQATVAPAADTHAVSQPSSGAKHPLGRAIGHGSAQTDTSTRQLRPGQLP